MNSKTHETMLCRSRNILATVFDVLRHVESIWFGRQNTLVRLIFFGLFAQFDIVVFISFKCRAFFFCWCLLFVDANNDARYLIMLKNGVPCGEKAAAFILQPCGSNLKMQSTTSNNSVKKINYQIVHKQGTQSGTHHKIVCVHLFDGMHLVI